jgi:general secretion pathway protein G
MPRLDRIDVRRRAGNKQAKDAFQGAVKVEARRRAAHLLLSVGIGCMLLAAMVAVLVVPRAIRFLQPSVSHKSEIDIFALCCALDDYATRNDGRYPEALEELVTPDENGRSSLGRRRLPIDRWGRKYGYAPPVLGGRWPKVYTLGRDGLVGGEGEDADFDSFMLRGISD